MRLGIDARSLGPLRTGVGTYLHEILRCWSDAKSEEEIHLFSHQPICLDVESSCKSHVTPASWGLLWYLFQSSRSIRTCEPNIFWGAQNLLPTSLPDKISAVITIHDWVHRWGVGLAPSLAYNLIHRYYVPRSIRKSNRILAVSRFVADEIMKYYGAPSHFIEITPLGVNKAFWKSQLDPGKISSVLNRLELEPPYILGVGTLEPRKNLTVLLEAFALLPVRHQRTHQLVLVGKKGWGEDKLLELIRSHPQCSQIRLPGYVLGSDLPYVYAAAEMFVYPTVYEGFGLPALEAMAAGCPVVASKVASLPEVVGSAGYWVETIGSSSDWSKAICRLAESRELRESLSSEGILRAAHFPWEKCAKLTREVLLQAAHK